MSILSTIDKDLRRRLVYAHLAIIVVIAVGAVGFYLIEGLDWLDSIYFTTSTVTTVGYGDIVPETRWGRYFATVLMLVGVGTVLYALSILAQAFIHTELISTLGMRRRSREMEKLSNHFIICGAGRVGRRVIRSLQMDAIPFVVIEWNEEKVDLIVDCQRQYILLGDATLEHNLQRAGVERAAGLATCLSDDASNIYVVLTARDLNRELHIVARAVEEQAEPKLVRAGANRVVSPTIIGSLSMVRALIKPAIADFMDSIVAENLDLVFEEIPIREDSRHAGVKLRDSNLGSEFDILVVAIRRKAGEMIFNPTGDTEIAGGDLLIVIGQAESLHRFKSLDLKREHK